MTQVLEYLRAKGGDLRPPERILEEWEGPFPTPEEVRAERITRLGDYEGSYADFGWLVGQFRIGGERGQALKGQAYSRQYIEGIEKGRIEIGKPFAYAFRSLQGHVPQGVRFMRGVMTLMEVPPGAVLVFGKIVRCQICGRLLIAHPLTKYCPKEVNPECRREARRRRRNGSG